MWFYPEREARGCGAGGWGADEMKREIYFFVISISYIFMVLHGAQRRIRPALMTSATTILALIPILTSTGRGSDIMVPMAIPSFGGMIIAMLTVFVVPVLYCWVEERNSC
ncbi:MAG: efflux RND transporter permease subunit [Candidatus Electrothrix aestuarii]|uniref:Efflux RND transporter permease subunit n=1 Tax=Candidatus Electrothrix aestuarii TaxID=3062594 RepID=A0AAU8LZ48_9BACT|nr:efflux RND transporter permease subunit [Candidatus Electrothrix aestuarii]